MKDYYKILGIKEEASGEEIRARWIELIKHYHPDSGKAEGEDETIKEINEAYEILENESTRFDYDLQRTLKRSIIKKTRRPKESRIYIRKIILPVGMVVLFLIVGLISFTWLRVAAPPKSEVPDEVAKGIERKTTSQIPSVEVDSGVKAQKRVPEEIKTEVMPPESEKIASVSPQASPSAVKRELEKKEKFGQKILPRAGAPTEVKEKVLAKEEPKPVKEPDRQGMVKSEARVRVDKEVSRDVPREVPKEPTVAILRPGKKLSPKTEEEKKEAPRDVPREVSKEPTVATLHPGKKLVLKTEEEKRTIPLPPPPLANEKEVKQFFSNYIDQYHQKDIGGFLSFFSSQAVQNQKDGMKQIKNIYTKFFGESKELQYQLEEMKTEIYQNAVEVKARFRVNQILKRGGEEKVWTGTIHWVLVKEDGALKIISLNYQNQKSP